MILVDTNFWEGLVTWLKEKLQKEYQYIGPNDLDLIHLTDDPDEVVKIIKDFYKKRSLRPNF